jgi:uncharacterized protein YbjT (DUF2867 family)
MRTDAARKLVLVAGATGRLGGAVDALIARGHRVRALTRTPDSPAAARLRSIGAELVRGDFDDPASIESAARGVDAMFATGTAHQVGPDGELRHGRNVAAAAAAAGVSHLVYSSGDGAAPDSPLPLFRAKFEVERHIRSLGVRHTILAPVYFMENLFNPWNVPELRAGRLPSPIPVGQSLQQAAIEDVVAFAALAISTPEDFAGRRIAIASDELSAEQAATSVSRVLSRHFEPARVPVEELGPGLRALFEWLEHVGHAVDIESMRDRHPEVSWHRFEDWARSQIPRLSGICPHPAPLPH